MVHENAVESPHVVQLDGGPPDMAGAKVWTVGRRSGNLGKKGESFRVQLRTPAAQVFLQA